jgi:hypothetical protein
VTNIPASYSGGPVSNLSLDTSYIDWDFSFFSVPPGKCKNGALN